jgi:hypothetical protein
MTSVFLHGRPLFGGVSQRQAVIDQQRRAAFGSGPERGQYSTIA